MNTLENENQVSDDACNPNADDAVGLGPRHCGRLLVGSVDEVNGEGALPCPEYVATRHELLELARYWANQVLFIETTFYYERQIGSEWRIINYGRQRLDRIVELLDLEAVRAVVSEVEDKYRQEMGDDDWAIFKGNKPPKDQSDGRD